MTILFLQQPFSSAGPLGPFSTNAGCFKCNKVKLSVRTDLWQSNLIITSRRENKENLRASRDISCYIIYSSAGLTWIRLLSIVRCAAESGSCSGLLGMSVTQAGALSLQWLLFKKREIWEAFISNINVGFHSWCKDRDTAERQSVCWVLSEQILIELKQRNEGTICSFVISPSGILT